ncbi:MULTISPECIES: branched-chain amino acid ABC transporter permease [Microbacterium]|uniref:branched-chain amino acid ABC transporter permease n=1 Tax=Microbacterium TaxID=33882 RepID=UPI0027852B6C|nr:MULTISPECIES: branched-chain amino acid ABC transporter permease [Microbacterium]MDQ1074247.1 neutral amino acid transport system permease protein [Microbacterium sp. SORGH_AS_0969]MDQ1114474.1 neutral amino acid transport system permease protein [Microbacterium testaceum]
MAILVAFLASAVAVLSMFLASPASAQTTTAPTPVASTGTGDVSTQYTIGGIIRAGDDPLEGVEVAVEGSGFSEVGTTGADGRWSVSVPGPGTYTAELKVDTLPDGVVPRDPDNVTRDVTIGTTNTVNVLFPTGEGTAASGSIWDTLFSRFFYGLNFGLLLALAAIGISLIFGTTGVNNFAHGEMLTFGAIIFYVFTAMGWNLLLAVVLTVALSAALGWTQDAVLFKPLRKRGVGLVQVLIVTIGLSIVLRYLYLYFFDGGTRNITTGITDNVTIGPVTVTLTSIISMGVSIVMLAAVGYFLTRTRIGKATRAVSDNASLAAASGINVDRVIRIVWVMAGALTGLSGVLYGLYRGVTWDMGFAILLLLFAAVTLGGLGSAFGALVGSLIIGIITELSTIVIPPDLRYAVALIVLIGVLLFRPQGVLGRKERIG